MARMYLCLWLDRAISALKCEGPPGLRNRERMELHCGAGSWFILVRHDDMGNGWLGNAAPISLGMMVASPATAA